MPDVILDIIILILFGIAISFYLAGFFGFYCSRLTIKNSVSTRGTLIGFRQYYLTDEYDNSIDNSDNKKGRVPIFEIVINRKKLHIPTNYYKNELTKADIGKQFKVRYRRFMGITLMIDEKEILMKHNKKKILIFLVFMIVATISLIVSFLLFVIYS